MLRNARNRQAHAGEGPGGKRCRCCRVRRGIKFRAADKRQWQRDHRED